MNVTDEQALLLAETGFKAGWVRDLQDGDEVFIPRFLANEIEEYLVSGLWDSNRGDGGYIRHFIGHKSDGTERTCAFGYEYPIYFRREVGS